MPINVYAPEKKPHPLFTIAFIGPIIGFTLGAVIDHALIPEHGKPEQEWCDAAYVRKADWGSPVKSTLRPKISTLVASGGENESDIIPRSEDSPQGR